MAKLVSTRLIIPVPTRKGFVGRNTNMIILKVIHDHSELVV